MFETVLGPLAALAATLAAISFGFRSFRDRPAPVRVPVRSGDRHEDRDLPAG